MAALSHEFNSDMNILSHAEAQLSPELFNNYSEFSDNFYNIDYLFESNDIFYSQNYNSQLPFDYNLHFQSLPEFQPFHCPKRQKIHNYNHIYSDINSGIINELQDYSTEVITPTLPDFSTAPVYGGGSCETAMMKPEIGRSLSAQSIAARQRRRRISEKTHELGKLIPGGPKMNTAEMFHAAYKYIKYLQAQIGILEFMGSYNQENRGLYQSEELEGFLESTLIQEKLYSMEKCLVPEKFMQELAIGDRVFESK